MKNIILLLLFFVGNIPSLGAAKAIHSRDASASTSLEAVCIPDVYFSDPQTCLIEGPAANLSAYAKVGITFPATILPAEASPAELYDLPFYYARLSDGPVPSYDGLPSVPNQTPNRYLEAGLKYISYSGWSENDVGKFFVSKNGDFIDGSFISRITVPDFRGLVFITNPTYPFGWIIDQATSQTQPGYGNPQDGKKYYRFNLVPAYETQLIKDTEWVRIGMKEWIEKRLIARVLPATTPPEGVTGGRWIDINLYDQTLAVYENYRLVFATLICSGQNPYFTKPGVFQIYSPKESDTMSGSFTADRSDYYYLEDVPWVLYYDEARAIHGAYWRTQFGYPASHGCINLSVPDAHWVFNWAKVGDWVRVWDPSGKTPTDPGFYTQGGA